MTRKLAAALQALLLLWGSSASAAPLVKLTIPRPVVGRVAPVAVRTAPAWTASGHGLKVALQPVVSLVPRRTPSAEKTSALASLKRHAPLAAEVSSVKELSAAKDGAEANFLQAAFGDALALSPGVEEERAGARGETRREVVLDNGLKVLLVSQPGLHSATVAVGYDVGGRDEGPQERGLSHFLEHMMYQGTTRVKDWFGMIAALGAQTHAETNHDYTIHTQRVTVNMLETALDLEAERMMNLDITPEKVERERKTILEEQVREVEEQPWERGSRKLTELLFSNPHNRSDVIGSQDDIRAITAEKLKRFLAENYTTERTRVAIVGGIDLDAAEALVRDTLGRVPKKTSAKPRADLADPEKPGQTAVVSDPTAPGPAVYVGWRAPAYGTPEYHAADVLVILLQQRLSEKLMGLEGKALGVNFAISSLLRGPGSIRGALTQAAGVDADELLAALQAEIDAVARGEYSDAELARAAQARVEALEQDLGARENAFLRVHAALHGASEQTLRRAIQATRAVTRAAVEKAAREVLAPGRRHTVKVVPGFASPKKAVASSAERAAAVDETPTPEEERLLETLAATPWPDFPYEAHKSVILPNGLKVLLVPSQGAKTYATLAFKLGPVAGDARSRSMLAFMATLLKSRTAAKDEQALAEAVWSLGGSLELYAGDHVVVQADAPAGNAAALLSLMSELFAHPRAWTDEDLARYKDWYKQAVLPEMRQAHVVSHTLAVRQLLGAGHPAANADVTAAAVDAMTPAEFSRLLGALFVPNNAVLVLADSDPEGLERALPGLFQDWKRGAVVSSPLPAVATLPQKALSLHDHGPVEQSYVRATAIGAINPGSPDYYALLVANQILGVGFGSRLWRTLRQTFGYAYHAASDLVLEPGLSMWTATLQTQTGKTAGAARELLEQLRLLRESAPTAVELGTAKNALIGDFWTRSVDVTHIASQVAGLELYGQDAGRWGDFPARIAAVTAEQVLAVCRKLWDPEKTNVAVVGDAAALRDALAEVMPVQEYDQDGKPKEPPSKPGFFASIFR